MSHIKFNTPSQHNIDDLDSAEIEQIQDLITEMKQSQEQLCQLINIEISALAETMDKFLPGFWSRFLENRHLACKNFIEHKQNNQFQSPLIADESE